MFGPPLIASKGNWGGLIYRADDGSEVYFQFKGPHVIGARYGDTEINGIAPPVRKLTLNRRADLKRYVIHIDDEDFVTPAALADHLATYPRGTILEYHAIDSIAADDFVDTPSVSLESFILAH